jgi:endonuclease-3
LKKSLTKKSREWDIIVNKLSSFLKNDELPSVSVIAKDIGGPFHILISTMISLRTKDSVTIEASKRLFKKAGNPEKLAALPEKEIAEIIYPAGFYKTKAKNIKKTAKILISDYNSKVPEKMEELLKLPGVGRKTANLVRNLGYNLNGICVDTHVHRISNRTGWVKTSNPEETEYALMEVLPEKYWILINELLVMFGQVLCKPISPFCSKCPIPDYCKRIGFTRSR